MAERKLQRDESANLVDRLARELAGMYADAELTLIEHLAVRIKKAYRTDQAIERVIRAGELRRVSERLAGRLAGTIPGMAEMVILQASQKGAASALASVEQVARSAGLSLPGSALVGSPAANTLITELVLGATVATQSILAVPDSIYRRAVAKGTPDVLLGLGTGKQAQLKAWRMLLRDGVSKFTDSGGRQWNLATYVEMATRTATRRAFTEAHNHQLTTMGLDLVTPVVGRDSCQTCSYWAGKVLSLDGSVGRVSARHATDDERIVSVNIAATLNEARARGFQHPNCRCQTVAYFPGLPTPADSTTYEPEREKQRQKLRRLEVEVRRSKIDQMTAVTPEQVALANERVRYYQGKIREHTAEANIRRRRDREQLNLGHKN